MQRIVFALAALALAACGGGGGGGGGSSGGPVSSNVQWAVDAAEARAVTDGLAPPAISSSKIAARLRTILDQADTLLLTDVYDPNFAVVGHISTNCRAGTCVTSRGRVNLDDLTIEDSEEYQAVMTRNGVTLGQYRSETKDADGITAQEIGCGAWLDHNAFSTSAASYYSGAVSDGYYAVFVAGYSFGDDSGSRPVGGSATWTGTMTGADLEFQNAVQGDAAVTVDFARNNAGVAFTNIKDLSTRSGLPSMEWSGSGNRNRCPLWRVRHQGHVLRAEPRGSRRRVRAWIHRRRVRRQAPVDYCLPRLRHSRGRHSLTPREDYRE